MHLPNYWYFFPPYDANLTFTFSILDLFLIFLYTFFFFCPGRMLAWAQSIKFKCDRVSIQFQSYFPFFIFLSIDMGHSSNKQFV